MSDCHIQRKSCHNEEIRNHAIPDVALSVIALLSLMLSIHHHRHSRCHHHSCHRRRIGIIIVAACCSCCTLPRTAGCTCFFFLPWFLIIAVVIVVVVIVIVIVILVVVIALASSLLQLVVLVIHCRLPVALASFFFLDSLFSPYYFWFCWVIIKKVNCFCCLLKHDCTSKCRKKHSTRGI